MVKIKICGITREDEIDYLNKLKLDYAGFVFAESKRKLDKEKALELCSKLDDSIKSVGVFRNQTISEIIDILGKVSLNVIQLHGVEDSNYIKQLRQKIHGNIEIWKAVSIDNIEKIKELNNEVYIYRDNSKNIINKKLIDKYLVDGVNPGSGQEYSVDMLRCIPDEIDYFLAGGVTPDNIKAKINLVHPFGVDVSSGVEYIDEFGSKKKSYKKIKLLLNNILGQADK